MMQTILQVERITKTFGSTVANKEISLSVQRGSIHGLAGENGSGKSTLSSIISGMLSADSGTIYKDGKEFKPENPVAANDAKVAMVVQELGIIGTLPPTINMFLGKTDRFSKMGIVDLKKMEAAAKEQFEKWELPEIPLTGKTEDLSVEQRKILELARALASEPDFLILDEISQALSQDNRKALYQFIEKFKNQGKSILMISHDLDEMLEVCDAISVLRDGVVIDTKAANAYTIGELQKSMIGREVSGNYYRDDQEENYHDEVILKVENLALGKEIEEVTFDLHKGEILAVCGLSNAGIHTLGKVLFGLEREFTGTITDAKTGKKLKRPQDVLKAGGAYLSKDRDQDGLMLKATVGQNLIVPNVNRLQGKLGFLSPKKVNAMSQKAADDFEVKCEGINSIVAQLSGGNKQKVNLSRWLVQELKFIILDCPTRGVDVGVKAYIYDVLKKAKNEGMGIIMISDELPEAMGMADRMLVMRNHVPSAILSRSHDFCDEKIAEVML